MEHPNLSRVQSRSVAEGWLTPEIPSLAAAISARPAERDPALATHRAGRVSRRVTKEPRPQGARALLLPKRESIG